VINFETIRAKNIANILTQLKEGKVLNEREQRILTEYEKEQSQSKALDEVFEDGIPTRLLKEHWQVSAPYLSKLRNTKGMPEFKSLADADRWREEHAPANARRQDAALRSKYHSSPAPSSSEINLDDTEEFDGDFDALVVMQSQQVTTAAFKLYMDSVRNGNDGQVSVRIKNWGEAAKQSSIVREKFLTLQEQAAILLPIDIVMDVVGNQLQSVVSRLDSMGTRIAKKANPDNPELALQVINEATDADKNLIYEAREQVKESIMKRIDYVEQKVEEKE